MWYYVAAGVAVCAVVVGLLFAWDHRQHRQDRGRHRVWSASRNAVVWSDELDGPKDERDL